MSPDMGMLLKILAVVESFEMQVHFKYAKSCMESVCMYCVCVCRINMA